MTTFVIDTNVLLVASRKATQANDECVKNCDQFLLDVKKYGYQICVDGFGEIIKEYRNKNQPRQSQNSGDQFLLYLLQNLQNKRLVKQVEITKDDETYLDFPDDLTLKKFDPSDKKFVAVAIASKKNPEIVNAVDTDWMDFESVLNQYVRLKFLC